MIRTINLFRFLLAVATAFAIAAATAQTSTSTNARQQVNLLIQPNGTRAITATTLNGVLNKILDAVDSSGSGLQRVQTPVLAGSINGTTASLSWSAVPEGYNYRVQQSSSSNFSSPSYIYSDRGYATTVSNLTGANYFRLQAQGFERLNSNWSTGVTLTAGTGTLGPPEPFNIVHYTATTMDLSWGAVFNAESYTIDRSLSSNFSSISASNSIGAPQTTYAVTGLTAGVQYYYRIRANATGYTSGPYMYNDATTYNQRLNYTSATSSNAASVEGTVISTNPNIKFDFNSIISPTGTGQTMDIFVGSGQQISITYPSAYNGTAFAYTDASGTPHYGVFTNGTVNF